MAFGLVYVVYDLFTRISPKPCFYNFRVSVMFQVHALIDIVIVEF